MEDIEFFNSVAERWDEICHHPQDKINYIMDKIQLKNGYKILDIGSGTGVAIPFLQKRIGKEGSIVALDIAEKMIELSKKKNIYANVDFVVEDFYKYNPSEHFDCILAYSCYPHFKDKEAFFNKAFSILKTGGKIVIAHVESREKINSRHKEIETRLTSDKLPEVNITAEILRKANFNIAYTEDNSEYYICIGEKY